MAIIKIIARAALLGGSLLMACSSKKDPTGPSGTPGGATKLAMVTQPQASVADRETLDPAPVVQLTKGDGTPVSEAGIEVLVSLGSGGGTVVGTTTVATDADGKASFDDISIGGAAGAHSLKFSTTATFSITSSNVTLTAGPATTLTLVSANNQSALVSQVVAAPPSVKVADQDGNGVSGVTVLFAVTQGGGSIAPVSGIVASNAAGLATLTSWTMGAAAGSNQVTATSVGLAGSPLTITATAIVSNFNIVVVFQGTFTPDETAAFNAAAARWSRAIVGDLSDFSLTAPANDCFDGQPASDHENIDDVVIYARIVPIDGHSNTLGRSGPCYIRPTSPRLTILGRMEFDIADMPDLEAGGGLNTVILHEMGHVLGYGSLWLHNGFNFLVDPRDPADGGSLASDPHFIGANALAAFNGSNGGNTYTVGAKIPVENTGGTGTWDAHWRELEFKNELMTGFLTGTTQPMSLTTIMSFKDQGYVVNPSEAEPFVITPPPMIVESSVPLRALIEGRLSSPIRVLESGTGRVVQVIPRR